MFFRCERDLKKALPLICLMFAVPVIATAEETIKFPVTASSKVLGYAPLWVASGMGFLKREGLDSEVKLSATGLERVGLEIARPIPQALQTLVAKPREVTGRQSS